MMLPKLIYIASAYTASTAEQIENNIRTQIWAGHAVIDMGHVPVVPNLNHFMDAIQRRTYSEWMACDFALIKRCDAVLRLPGHSPGADREVELAQGIGLPVLKSLSELREWLKV
jgi:hypothetical protein